MTGYAGSSSPCDYVGVRHAAHPRPSVVSGARIDAMGSDTRK